MPAHFNIAKDVARRLEGFSRVAFRPDHPLLLAGPDVLAGVDGFLYAFFIRTMGEMARANDLLARLAISRLALPTHSTCILVADSLLGSSLYQTAIEHHFDQIVNATEVPRFVRSRFQNEPYKRRQLVKVRRAVFSQAAVLYRAAVQFGQKVDTAPGQVFQELRERKRGHSLLIPSWVEPAKSRRSIKFITTDHIVATTAYFAETTSVRARLEPILNFGMRFQYSLDNGVPYKHSASVNTIIVDEIPEIRHDPLKPLRCAAFSGWSIVAPDSYQNYERTVASIDRRLKRASNI